MTTLDELHAVGASFSDVRGDNDNAGPTLEQLADPGKENIGDPIAAQVLASFMRAQRWRIQAPLGGSTVENVLNECYQQYHGIVTPDEQELMDRAGANLKVSLTRYKVDVLVAWLRDLFQNAADSPFTVTPTPIPSLSESSIQNVVARVKAAFMGASGSPPPEPGSSPEVVHAWMRGMIDQEKQAMADEASAKATAMQTLIDDQLIDGDFRSALVDFMTNFALYPLAVMLGPMVESRPELKWHGDKLTETVNHVPVCRAISPFDYFPSPDTKKCGTGTFDIIREKTTRRSLQQCAELPGYIKENIEAALLEQSTQNNTLQNWLSPNPDDQNRLLYTSGRYDDSTTVLRYFGTLSGKMLAQYGIGGVPDNEYREIEAVVLGRWTLQVVANRYPKTVGRPIYAAAYRRTPGQVWGYGIAQTLRDVERAYMGAMRATLTNAAFSALPIGEVDFSRVERYMTREAATIAVPGTINPVSASLGGGTPAYYFHNVPSSLGQMMQLMGYFMQLADQISGLPAALSGQPVGTGVNRTFRGVAQLYANALKGVQSALVNMDTDLFEPVGYAYFVYNMLYSKDSAVKGDAQVISRGLSGQLQKEITKQNALDVLQIMAPLAQANAVPSNVMEWAVRRALIASGVPESLYDQGVEERKQQAQAMPAAQGAPQGVPGQAAVAQGPEAGGVPPPMQ